ncbi:MAG: hypothetical protein LBS06_02620 [Treponema sp.]|jgi:hypothetical protein|nr:hypothetical protein [Treponema sp.]
MLKLDNGPEIRLYKVSLDGYKTSNPFGMDKLFKKPVPAVDNFFHGEYGGNSGTFSIGC